ncbi:MAG: hypothetical protein OHK0013_26860 [Sandaracinaceae bacterium]
MSAPARTVLSFKLRPFDEHAWIVREGEPHGRTLRGEEARRAFALGEALFALVSPEAPSRVRALSVDCTRWRLLATVDDGDDKPRAVRIDGERVRAATSADLLAFLRG